MIVFLMPDRTPRRGCVQAVSRRAAPAQRAVRRSSRVGPLWPCSLAFRAPAPPSVTGVAARYRARSAVLRPQAAMNTAPGLPSGASVCGQADGPLVLGLCRTYSQAACLPVCMEPGCGPRWQRKSGRAPRAALRRVSPGVVAGLALCAGQPGAAVCVGCQCRAFFLPSWPAVCISG